MSGFVHLHGHSTYSLLDGACRVPNLARQAAEQGAPALALTDHGNLFGAIEFYQQCRQAGVKPLLGFEAYVAPKSRMDRERNPVAAWHLTLLAENHAGWKNLLKLSSAGYMEGFYYVPRIDRELLARHSEGVIVLSGCLSSETSYWLRRDRQDKAEEAAGFYHETFGDRYFLEIQRHGIEDQEKCLAGCVDLSRRLGRPLVATNDFHYEHREDADAQELLVCINTGKKLADENRMKMSSEELYFKPPAEMRTLFRDHPGACDTTLEIAERCNVDLAFGEMHLPQFDVPGGGDPDDYLRHLCEKGLRERYGDHPAAEVRERMERELGVIQRMGFTAYFLIVWDFIRHARETGIPVGPGRGSAAGSVIAYCLGIVDVDPLRFDLLFERFLNEERISMPDIDIDFCRDQRERVIHYVQEKYGGKERVAQIITFGRMAAKAVIRDVGRVLEVPLPEVDRIAKKVPVGPKVTLKRALESDDELRALKEEGDEQTRRLFEFALKLEGCHRNAGTHAAGVVIADAPLTEYVPLYKSGDDVSTQFSMDILDQLGLLKMDFLGLKTLTLIDTALRLLREGGKEVPDFEGEEFQRYEDQATYRLLQHGESFGVFQLESSGMRELMMKLKPTTFEEVIVLIALFRPGPLDAGMHDVYCNRKHGLEPVEYDHALLEPILKNTYGVIVYQEQVMLTAHQVAGFSLNEADSLRKAMGKKKPEVMEKFRGKFVSGCGERGVPSDTASEVWDKMATFAGYGFNKSHAAAYSVVTYQTAWLKAHHPTEFMAALLTVDSGNMDKVTEALEECRRMRIDVRNPDVNRSGVDFSVEGDAIRFGLTSVKGVGRHAAESVVEARLESADPFRGIFDFCGQVDHRHANKLTLEALIKAGACDDLGGHRAQLAAALDPAIRAAASEQADRRAGQMSLLGGPSEATAPAPKLPDVAEWTEAEMLRLEKETTGRYWSSHPLAQYGELVERFASHTTRSVRECSDGRDVVVGGLAVGVEERIIRSGRNEGKRMARFRIEDFQGTVDAVMFSDAYARCRDQLGDNKVFFCAGDVDASREEICLRVNELIEPADAPRELSGQIRIDVSPETDLPALRELVDRFRGEHPIPVSLALRPEPGLKVLIRADDAVGVEPTAEFLAAARSLVGERGVQLRAVDPAARRERRFPSRNGNGRRFGRR